MKECWQIDSNKRPTFTHLKDQLQPVPVVKLSLPKNGYIQYAETTI